MPSGEALLVGALVWAVATIGSLLVAVCVVVRLPEDHFEAPGRPARGGLAALALKNLLGLLLVAVGIVLSVPGVPGQGVLTVFVGVLLLDIPGKRRIERWIVGHALVLRALNRLRARWGRPPLRPPQA